MAAVTIIAMRWKTFEGKHRLHCCHVYTCRTNNEGYIVPCAFIGYMATNAAGLMNVLQGRVGPVMVSRRSISLFEKPRSSRMGAR